MKALIKTVIFTSIIVGTMGVMVIDSASAGSLRRHIKKTHHMIKDIIFDRHGYDRHGYNRHGRTRHGHTRRHYDGHGYDRHGYNSHGYNRRGRHSDGRYSRHHDVHH